MSYPSITTTSLPNGTISNAYSATLEGTGGVPPYNWTITSGSLPSGLSLNATTGVISGTPISTGTFSFHVALSDSEEEATGANLSIEIDSVGNPTLTPQVSDSFDYTGAPLPGPAWGNAINQGLQAEDGYCQAASVAPNYEEYIGASLPDDQYLSWTIQSFNPANSPAIYLVARASAWNVGYRLLVVAGNAESENSWSLLDHNADTLLSGSTLFNNGDTITLACVGSTIYVLQNTTVIGSVVDTQYTGGSVFIGLDPDVVTDALMTNFVAGAASIAPPPPAGGSIFLGSVVVVESAPAGESDPFLGTVTVIDSAPSGEPNPYLGKVVVGSAPSGVPNPSLGNVVVIDSKPSNVPDVFLGTVQES